MKGLPAEMRKQIPAVANPGRADAWGTAALLGGGTGRQAASHRPEKPLGRDVVPLRERGAGGHQGKQERSARFISASRGGAGGLESPKAPSLSFTAGQSPAGSQEMPTAQSGMAPPGLPAAEDAPPAALWFVRPLAHRTEAAN